MAVPPRVRNSYDVREHGVGGRPRNTDMRTKEEETQKNDQVPVPKPDEQHPDWVPRHEPDDVPAERSDKPADPSKL